MHCVGALCLQFRVMSYCFIITTTIHDLSLRMPKSRKYRKRDWFIIFHSPQKPLNETVDIRFGKQHVRKAKYVKFLGLLLDENLSWKYHLNELSKKLARTCGIFFKVRHLLPRNVLVSLYNSLFASFLQYGIVVWGLTCDSYIKPIFILQKKAVRAIAFEIVLLHLLLFFTLSNFLSCRIYLN